MNVKDTNKYLERIQKDNARVGKKTFQLLEKCIDLQLLTNQKDPAMVAAITELYKVLFKR